MAKFETDKKRVVCYLAKPLEEMAQKLIDEKGYNNTQAVLFEGLRKLYDATFPAYTLKQPSQARAQRTPEERAQEEIMKKKAVEEQKKEDALSICDALGGNVIGNSCHFKTYSKMYGKKIHEGAQAVPLDQLHENLLDQQYINTSKAEVAEQGL
tara:strand:+ start:824 stop:1285 length:462 start_codon:yes stop_codon:yes gene_type:complete